MLLTLLQLKKISQADACQATHTSKCAILSLGRRASPLIQHSEVMSRATCAWSMGSRQLFVNMGFTFLSYKPLQVINLSLAGLCSERAASRFSCTVGALRQKVATLNWASWTALAA